MFKIVLLFLLASCACGHHYHHKEYYDTVKCYGDEYESVIFCGEREVIYSRGLAR